MDGVLAAEAAVLGERELLFHFLLVARRLARDALALATLQLGHVVLDLAHTGSLVYFKIMVALYAKKHASSIFPDFLSR